MKDIISKKNIGNRLRRLRLQKDISQLEASAIFGLSRSHYSQVELGKQFPSYSVLHQIAEFYNKDYEWLLHGKDSNLNEDWEINPDGASIREQFPSVASDNEFHHIIYVKLQEEFNYINNRKDKNYITSLPYFAFPLDCMEEKNYRAFEVSGDSMNPFLHHQDVAIACELTDHTKLKQSNVYVLVMEQCIRIRRLEINADSTLLWVPENESYHSEKIKLNNIKELWEIKAKVSYKLDKDH